MSNLRYYLPSEVVVHNKPDDIWVSFLGKVYDVTPFIKGGGDKRLCKTLIAHAGKDVSYWFDSGTSDLKQVVDHRTGFKVDYITRGNAVEPSSEWKALGAEKGSTDEGPWWLGKCNQVGYLTKKSRPIRIVNALAPASHRENLIWVASEESLKNILERVLPYNSHAESYTPKFEGRVLHMMKTLDENKILDERDKYVQLGLTDDNYIPAIMLYYNDDLTRK